MENPATTGYAAVNGIDMYYEIHGEGGIPLVLIHGGGSTIETSFGRLLPLLAQKGKVIAVELQAHGRTSDRDTPESFERDAADVAALLRYLNVDKADILGFSDGGCTALQLAIDYAHQLHKIVVVSANYKRDGLIPGFYEGMAKATLADMPASLQEAFLKVTPDKDKLQVMFEKDVARRLAFTDLDDEKLQAIKTPSLIMASDQDVILTEHTVAMWRLIPGAKLAILPGTHGAFIGAAESGATMDSKLPGMVAQLVNDFLKE